MMRPRSRAHLLLMIGIYNIHTHEIFYPRYASGSVWGYLRLRSHRLAGRENNHIISYYGLLLLVLSHQSESGGAAGVAQQIY